MNVNDSSAEPTTVNYRAEDLNTPDEYGNAPLHRAVISDDMEMLDRLLEQSHIDVNLENYKGETPLVLGLRLSRSDSFIMRLIESGSDLNHTNKFGQSSLHVALLCSSVEVAHELIKGGASINAQDEDKRSALHYAVDNNDLEAVCMFLYYGADVSILCKDNMTPLMLALYRNRLDIVEALFDYYDDFSDMDVDGYTALHLAAYHQSPFAARLVKSGADVNCVTFDGTDPLMLSLAYEDAELFKLIWPIYDHRKLLTNEMSIFFTYFNTTSFLGSEWLECLYLILESPLVFDILEHYKNCTISLQREDCPNEMSRTFGCFLPLLWAFDRMGVDSYHRTRIIDVCLSFGWEIDAGDINLAYVFYGFKEELESFLYCSDYCAERSYCSDLSVLLRPSFLFGLENEPNNEEVLELLRYQIEYSEIVKPSAITYGIFDTVGFFALPLYSKEELVFSYQFSSDVSAITEKLESIPEFPSLLELSRNQTRKFIKQTYRIDRAYQFHDVVKNLNLPRRIQGIICFRIPLY